MEHFTGGGTPSLRQTSVFPPAVNERENEVLNATHGQRAWPGGCEDLGRWVHKVMRPVERILVSFSCVFFPRTAVTSPEVDLPCAFNNTYFGYADLHTMKNLSAPNIGLIVNVRNA
jgi:hypothetical protein